MTILTLEQIAYLLSLDSKKKRRNTMLDFILSNLTELPTETEFQRKIRREWAVTFIDPQDKIMSRLDSPITIIPMSKELWLEERKINISNCIERYMTAGKEVPQEWRTWIKEINSEFGGVDKIVFTPTYIQEGKNVSELTEIELLDFVYGKLINGFGETENAEYVLRFKEILNRIIEEEENKSANESEKKYTEEDMSNCFYDARQNDFSFKNADKPIKYKHEHFSDYLNSSDFKKSLKP